MQDPDNCPKANILVLNNWMYLITEKTFLNRGLLGFRNTKWIYFISGNHCNRKESSPLQTWRSLVSARRTRTRSCWPSGCSRSPFRPQIATRTSLWSRPEIITFILRCIITITTIMTKLRQNCIDYFAVLRRTSEEEVDIFFPDADSESGSEGCNSDDCGIVGGEE